MHNILSTMTPNTVQSHSRLASQSSRPHSGENALCITDTKRKVQRLHARPRVNLEENISSPGLCVKNSRTAICSVLGNLCLRSSFISAPDDESSSDQSRKTIYRKTITISLLCDLALYQNGFRLKTSASLEWWSFHVIRRRPTESLIFELCKCGSTTSVKRLLIYGGASVFDVDESGATPLHVSHISPFGRLNLTAYLKLACRYGKSELVQLLIEHGADAYLPDDLGNNSLHEVETYDRYRTLGWNQDILKIMDVFIRQSSVDPFEPLDCNQNFDSMTLYNGLPFETLRYVLAHNISYAKADQLFDFILGNILYIPEGTEKFEESIDLLLTYYERLLSNKVTEKEWRYNFTLLQHLVFHWLNSEEGGDQGSPTKITRALARSRDLWRRDREGTPLDTIARYDGDMIPQWLKFLSKNSIDMTEYAKYEK